MKSLNVLVLICLPWLGLSQHSDSLEVYISKLNQEIDNAVVEKNLPFLNSHYAPDFVFTHGTGAIDNKESWMSTLKNPMSIFISRQHDSTVVEIHDDIAIVTGKLLVIRKDKTSMVNYGLRFVRVYRKEKVWLLISHRTTAEWHH